MVNAKAPFASVMLQKAGEAYGAPSTPRTAQRPHKIGTKKNISYFPRFFCFLFLTFEGITLDFVCSQKRKEVQTVWGTYVVSTLGLQHTLPATGWTRQDLAFTISLALLCIKHSLATSGGLLADSRSPALSHSQARLEHKFSEERLRECLVWRRGG